jgi:hypothetical protein
MVENKWWCPIKWKFIDKGSIENCDRNLFTPQQLTRGGEK